MDGIEHLGPKPPRKPGLVGDRAAPVYDRTLAAAQTLGTFHQRLGAIQHAVSEAARNIRTGEPGDTEQAARHALATAQIDTRALVAELTEALNQ